MTDVDCAGGEGRLDDCTFPGLGEGECLSGEHVGVNCFADATSHSMQGAVRLANRVNGTNYVEGNVNVFFNGQWGGFCAAGFDGFGTEAATVACRQLGFSDQGKACVCRRDEKFQWMGKV